MEAIRFLSMIEQAPLPCRADRSGGGTLPSRALRYCEALTTATAFGWWVFCPTDLHLLWDGDSIFWCCEGLEDWVELTGAAQFPHQADAFDQEAPPHLRGLSPPFLTRLNTPGMIQIWTGLIARVSPGWSILLRAPANLPKPSGIDYFEGILEADRRHLPLFVNLRIKRTDRPILLRSDLPLAQVQPLQRQTYSEQVLNAVQVVPRLADFGPDDWAGFESAFPARDPSSPGQYAVSVRKRRRQELANA